MARIGILYCIDALPSGGGTENQLAGLIRRLDRSAFDVHLCTLRHAARTPALGDCHVLPLRVGSLGRPRSWLETARLSRYLRRHRVDIVQTFFQDATVVGALAARVAAVPVRLGSFRDLGFWRTPRQEALMRRVYPLLNGFVANSQAVKRHFCEHDGLAPESVTVIPNGIDATEYEFVDHAERDGLAVGIVGNLNREVKRTDLFVEAAAALAPDHPGVTWHVLGDGNLRASYESLARERGLDGKVVFAGRVDPANAYLGRLAIGVICSDSEGFSNAILEYMLRGCAVVATAVGGNAEAVRDGETGLLVPPGDSGALARALDRLLRDADARRAMARRARAEAERRFAWAACVAGHERCYRQALERSRRGQARRREQDAGGVPG